MLVAEEEKFVNIAHEYTEVDEENIKELYIQRAGAIKMFWL